LEAEIKIVYDSAKIAKSVANAVSADDSEAPEGLLIQTENQGKLLVSKIIWHKGFGTFVATVDDLLFSIATAEKALRGMKRQLDSALKGKASK
jgi:hypothetical protein